MHVSVLRNEVVDLLVQGTGGTYVDGTVGAGGHAEAILGRIGAAGFLLGIDRDAEAISRTEARLSRTWAGRFKLVQGNYADIRGILAAAQIRDVRGILCDLGVSSYQLEGAERGFSFALEGPLDMRLDRSGGPTAADLVNGLGEAELAALIRDLGEDVKARAIARAMVRERTRAPIGTTRRLAEIVEQAAGGRRGRLHPATRTFQALRIRVNDELGALRRGLVDGLSVLAEGGRMAVIAFHSLEDREVKECFRAHAGRWESLQQGGRRWVGERPPVRRMTHKPVTPGEAEVRENPRSRSAKLRVVQRISETELSENKR